MDKDRLRLKKVDTLDLITTYIYKDFTKLLPFMTVLFSFKSLTGKQYVYQMLQSLPATKFVTQERNLIFNCSWKGDNKESFFTQTIAPKKSLEDMEDEEAWNVVPDPLKKPIYDYTADKSYDSNPFSNPFSQLPEIELPKKSSKPKYYLNNKYDKYNKYPKNKTDYAAKSLIVLNDVNKVIAYDWGFEIHTDIGLNCTVVRTKVLRSLLQQKTQSTSNNYFQIFSNIIQHSEEDLLGKEIDLPSESISVSDIKYIWSFKDIVSDISDDQFETMLDDMQTKTKKSVIDVGQFKGKNIDFFD